MGRAPAYTREHHQRLWEVWYETRNLSEACRRVNVSHQTGLRWKDKGFVCPHNCPYHDFEGLAHDVAKANQARLEAINSGVTDPGQIDSAMRSQLSHQQSYTNSDSKMIKYQDAPAMEIIRKNDLIVGDFEYLYRKLFFIATGQALEPNAAIISEHGDEITIDWGAEYAKGLKVNSLDKAIESLIHLRNEIDKRTGVSAMGLNGVVLEQTTETKKVTIPLEQLAQMREHLLKVKEQMHPDVREAS